MGAIYLKTYQNSAFTPPSSSGDFSAAIQNGDPSIHRLVNYQIYFKQIVGMVDFENLLI